MKFQIQNLRFPALRSFSEGGALQRSDAPAEEALEEFRQAWSIGTETFRRECLERMEGKVGENHPGQTRLRTASAERRAAAGPIRLLSRLTAVNRA